MRIASNAAAGRGDRTGKIWSAASMGLAIGGAFAGESNVHGPRALKGAIGWLGGAALKVRGFFRLLDCPVHDGSLAIFGAIEISRGPIWKKPLTVRGLMRRLRFRSIKVADQICRVAFVGAGRPGPLAQQRALRFPARFHSCALMRYWRVGRGCARSVGLTEIFSDLLSREAHRATLDDQTS